MSDNGEKKKDSGCGGCTGCQQRQRLLDKIEKMKQDSIRVRDDARMHDE